MSNTSLMVSAIAVGDLDAAIDFAIQACDEREPLLVLLARNFPDLQRLREDLRFARCFAVCRFLLETLKILHPLEHLVVLAVHTKSRINLLGWTVAPIDIETDAANPFIGEGKFLEMTVEACVDALPAG